MLITLIVLFIWAIKFQLYPLAKQSYWRDILVYVLLYGIASVLLMMITFDINSISLLK